jgi:hypothetical protein
MAARFTEEERRSAWREQTAELHTIRRGKQGLGFSSSTGRVPAAAGADRSDAAARSSLGIISSSSSSRKKGVQGLDPAALISGYEQMTAADKLKARMKLVMQHAEKNKPAAAADPGGATWTRFVFDQHGELEEDKAARQALMDREVGQGGIGGDAADTDGGVFGTLAAAGEGGDHNIGAAFIMGTGRAAARRVTVARAKESAHEDAIFGRPYSGHDHLQDPVVAGMGSNHATCQEQGDSFRGGLGGSKADTAIETAIAVATVALPATTSGNLPEADDSATQQLAESLGVSAGLLVAQTAGKQSWRDRALALKAKKQQ